MYTPVTALPIGPQALSIAELSAARLDGELYPLADRYCTVDLPAFPSLRAASLLLLLPEHAFVERLSAAWLHGALTDPPTLSSLAVPAGAGSRPRRSRTFTLRQVAVSPAELTLIGGCPVTTAERTLVDVLLDEGLGDAEALAVALTLCATGEVTLTSARAALRARRSLPHRTLAERRLSALAGLSRR